MSDFQNYLDTVFADLDTRVVKEETVYNYDIYKKISTDVIKARKELGLTQSQLAEKLISAILKKEPYIRLLILCRK